LAKKDKILAKLLEFEKAKKHQNEATKASTTNYIQIRVFSFIYNFGGILLKATKRFKNVYFQ